MPVDHSLWSWLGKQSLILELLPSRARSKRSQESVLQQTPVDGNGSVLLEDWLGEWCREDNLLSLQMTPVSNGAWAVMTARLRPLTSKTFLPSS